MHKPEKDETLTVRSLAAEGQEGFQPERLAGRLARYSTARENALQFADYLKTLPIPENKLAQSLRDCGNYAVFHDYFTIGEVRLAAFCTCKKHLICPLCALRRGAKALRVYIAKVEQLQEADHNLKAYLVTITVKNGSDLLERFKHLSNNLRAYHKRRTRTRQKGEILKAKSAVFSYEFTNKEKGWHPHVHAIWLCHVAPDASKISQEWKDLTSDSFIVDVKTLDMSDPAGSFCEVFKYALKFSDLQDSDRLHAYKTLKGKRLQDSFGALRGLDIEPSDTDDLLEELPYIKRFFHHVRGIGYVEKMLSGEIQNMIAA